MTASPRDPLYGWATALGTKGFNRGEYRWVITVIDGGAHSWCMLGVCSDKYDVHSKTAKGAFATPKSGAMLMDLADGSLYYKGQTHHPKQFLHAGAKTGDRKRYGN